MANPNAPKKGDSIKVDPIRSIKDIKAIKKLLADHPRNLCLFTLGINTNLRASDLLRITAGDVRHLQPGDSFSLKEKKTGKDRMITLNKSVVDTVQGLLKSEKYLDTDPLFRGQREHRDNNTGLMTRVLTVPTVHKLVSEWCKTINLKGNFGSHTLRKTFGHIQHIVFKTPLPELMVCFNHSSQRQTLDYLCIQEDGIKSVYMNEI